MFNGDIDNTQYTNVEYLWYLFRKDNFKYNFWLLEESTALKNFYLTDRKDLWDTEYNFDIILLY